MSRVAAVGLACLMLTCFLAGCIETGGSGGTSSSNDIQSPDWEIGDWWLYTFSTPDYSDDTARLVVASDSEEGGTAYMLAISSVGEARRHAVLNHNPFLGRITHDNLSTFENGIPQPVLNFPLSRGASWEFGLFSIDWTADIISISGGVAIISADSSDGSTLDYVYDSNARFFKSFIWTDSSGVVQLRMMLADEGASHSGDVYFVRGGDLYSNIWDSGTDFEFQDSFFVSDHPNDGEWDEMIYFLDASCGGGSSSITLTLRDHGSISALERVWGPGASESGTLGTIPYPSEEYTLTATFTGENYLRLIFAGGITQSWSL
ncbi:MAG TPA: hypothetical protein HA315_02935 [Candidatus Thalassarchaeaceae archaeon]|nr:MAG TPA: hypothetical protein D7H72_02925 [Candidatus Poseidoniales archaeon]HII34935.1 hypothetical protein [Candidatus Thalassarchaeaceae archaeon]|tara:strand:+ start:2113 stop:3069 length:957 start_codon:yes stop_codon:yes gene_type:complete